MFYLVKSFFSYIKTGSRIFPAPVFPQVVALTFSIELIQVFAAAIVSKVLCS